MENIREKSDSVIVNTYGRFPAVMVEGSGCTLKDSGGREYLDFVSGIAVCSLGHCHPKITEAICNQANKLVHVSNLYYTVPQVTLADMLVSHSFADRVFFANSGAEANEAALKLARKHGGEGRYEVISLEGSFHGRTLATVAATGQAKFHKGFAPLPGGFRHAPFGNIDALENMISENTCAVLCEPLQGEGGVRPLSAEYLQAIRALCDTHGLLLIFDEVQVGMGRTGTLFAYEHFGVIPDILTSAKALANGLPIGAMMTSEKVGASFGPGDHASTFGGNPVACEAAIAAMNIILAEGFLEEIKEKGDYLNKKLQSLADRYPHIALSARGKGLIQGLVLTPETAAQGADLVKKMFDKGVLVILAGGDVLRCLPPLIVTREEIDFFTETLDEVLEGM
jgi:acetylornithine aminotransferase/acetylornithine/N-succinyldiaminopimelate aminotransferase